jgi:hypothetical protein
LSDSSRPIAISIESYRPNTCAVRIVSGKLLAEGTEGECVIDTTPCVALRASAVNSSFWSVPFRRRNNVALSTSSEERRRKRATAH